VSAEAAALNELRAQVVQQEALEENSRSAMHQLEAALEARGRRGWLFACSEKWPNE
jgi:hypothetical protein